MAISSIMEMQSLAENVAVNQWETKTGVSLQRPTCQSEKKNATERQRCEKKRLSRQHNPSFSEGGLTTASFCLSATIWWRTRPDPLRTNKTKPIMDRSAYQIALWFHLHSTRPRRSPNTHAHTHGCVPLMNQTTSWLALTLELQGPLSPAAGLFMLEGPSSQSLADLHMSSQDSHALSSDLTVAVFIRKHYEDLHCVCVCAVWLFAWWPWLPWLRAIEAFFAPFQMICRYSTGPCLTGTQNLAVFATHKRIII